MSLKTPRVIPKTVLPMVLTIKIKILSTFSFFQRDVICSIQDKVVIPTS